MGKSAITTVKTVVESIRSGGDGIRIFTLVDPDHWELPPFRPAAHIDLYLPDKFVRTYSLCNDPADDRRYVVAVKREEGGRGGSALLHDRIAVGDVVGVSLPRGGIEMDKPAARYVFVAGGIGVTPFVSAASHLRRIGHGDFTIHLASRGSMPLADELQALVEDGRVVWHDTGGGVRPTMDTMIGGADDGTVICCCGPEGMLDAFEQAAEAWPAGNVHIERFTPVPMESDPDAKPFTVVLAKSGREIAVPAGRTMLQALQEAEIDVPTSCCGGICGACKVGWIDGKPLHRDRVLSAYERERFLMVCVAGAESERLVLDL